MDTGHRYRAFSAVEAAGTSPTYERLALAVAESTDVLDLLDDLPPSKRQPNLLLAAARFVDAPVVDERKFLAFVIAEWELVSAIMRARSTQTNEAARTGTFLPLLAAIRGPIALVEVGCSAGLCLYPDRYGISYDRQPPLNTTSAVRIDVTTCGAVPVPSRLPEVVARIGVDLNPIDITDADGRAWLEALIWPEHDERRRRLRAAATVVAEDPPQLITGDLLDHLDDALRLVPDGVTPVVFHSAVLNYLEPTDRARCVTAFETRPDVVWIANEGPGVIQRATTHLRPPAVARADAFFIVSRGGSTVAISDPHGAWIRWPQAALP